LTAESNSLKPIPFMEGGKTLSFIRMKGLAA
jgi:hypothetical protein